MIRTIIVEDEPQSQETLSIMLKRYPADIEVADICATPATAIASIARHQPDLVFLDIQMPKMNGFEMLKQISPVTFDVIFTTAFDQYAINAVRISALDYLLKPIDREELAAAIEKCRQRISEKHPRRQIDVLLDNLQNKNPLGKTLALSVLDGIIFVKMNDILRVEANGRYSKFFLINKETILISKTLGDYEEILTANQFYRISDSAIINLNQIKKFKRIDGGTVILTDDTELDVSRRRKDDFVKLFPKL